MATIRTSTLNFGTIGDTVSAGDGASAGNALDNINGTPLIAAGFHDRGIDVSGSSGVNCFIGWAGFDAGLTFAVRYYIKITTAASALGQVFTVRNNSNYILGNNLTTANKLTVTQWGGSSKYNATTTLSLNVWYRVEMIGTIVGVGTGTVQFKLFTGDSTTVLEDSGAITAFDLQASNATGMRLGKHGSSGTMGVIVEDPIITNTASFIGPYSGAVDGPVGPSSVVSNPGGFSIFGGAADLVTAVSDASDTTGAASPGAPSGAYIEYALPSLTPNRPVKISARHNSPTDTGNISRLYELRQGSTVIAPRTVNPLPTAVTLYEFTTSSGETAAITNWADLRVRVTDTLV